MGRFFCTPGDCLFKMPSDRQVCRWNGRPIGSAKTKNLKPYVPKPRLRAATKQGSIVDRPQFRPPRLTCGCVLWSACANRLPGFYFHVFETPDADARTSTYIVIHGHSPVNREKIISLLGLDDPRYWDPKSCDFKGTWADNFGQDRGAMKQDWSGLGGVEKEDAIMSLSMGPIFDRTQEHLVAADQAVVRLRRRLLDCVKLVENGEEPLGLLREDLGNVSCTSDAPLDQPWQTVGHRYEIPPAQAAE